jgi:hypothetical protein
MIQHLCIRCALIYSSSFTHNSNLQNIDTRDFYAEHQICINIARAVFFKKRRGAQPYAIAYPTLFMPISLETMALIYTIVCFVDILGICILI